MPLDKGKSTIALYTFSAVLILFGASSVVGLGYFYVTNIEVMTSTINSVADQLLFASDDLRELMDYPLTSEELRTQIESFETYILENKEQIDEVADSLSDQIFETVTNIKELTVEDILTEDYCSLVETYSTQLAAYGNRLKQTTTLLPYVSIYIAVAFVMVILMGISVAILTYKNLPPSTITQSN